MEDKKKSCNEGVCRDGAFVLLFVGKIEEFLKMKFFLARRNDDKKLFEPLGGGFDLRDLLSVHAGVRETKEEANIEVDPEDLIPFACMTQKVPALGIEERGYVFYFFKELDDCKLTENAVPSEEHTELGWHTLADILEKGESLYLTSALRAILHLLNFLENKKYRIDVLGTSTSFKGYRF